MPGIYNGFTGSERMKAYRWLMAEYAAGRRAKPTSCDVCLQTAGVIEPHSEDYSAPYGDNIGRWGLCRRCHHALHRRFRNPEMFRRYSESLAAGELSHEKTIPPGFAKLLDEGAAVIGASTVNGRHLRPAR